MRSEEFIFFNFSFLAAVLIGARVRERVFDGLRPDVPPLDLVT